MPPEDGSPTETDNSEFAPPGRKVTGVSAIVFGRRIATRGIV